MTIAGSSTVNHARLTELKGLTGIRAFAAGWVVLEHFLKYIIVLIPQATIVHPWIRPRFLGVEVFFVLSGFIIAYNYADRFSTFSWGTYKKFLELRFARIYPVHLVTFITVVLMIFVASRAGMSLSAGENYTPLSFFSNLFMLQALPGISSWNPPAWSISTEFVAYLAFPLIAAALVWVRTARRGFLVAGLLAVSGVVVMQLVAFVNDSPTGPVMVWLRIVFEFTMGCFLYAGWRHLGSRRFGAGWDWAAFGALGGIAVVVWLVGAEGSVALVTVPLIALLVLACAGATGPIGRILSTRVMLWGGRVSYSVYMTHFLLLMVLGDTLSEHFSSASLPIRMAIVGVYLGGSVIVGATCYYVVEEPSRKLIRRVIARKKIIQDDPLSCREFTSFK